MEQLILKAHSLNWMEIIAALNILAVSLIAVFSVIPSEQPEKFLRAFVDVLAKLSKKPKG